MTAFPIEMRELYPEWFKQQSCPFMVQANGWARSFCLGSKKNFVRIEKTFDDDDLVLAEYSATVVGMQFLYQKSRNIEEDVFVVRLPYKWRSIHCHTAN